MQIKRIKVDKLWQIQAGYENEKLGFFSYTKIQIMIIMNKMKIKSFVTN